MTNFTEELKRSFNTNNMEVVVKKKLVSRGKCQVVKERIVLGECIGLPRGRRFKKFQDVELDVTYY